MPEHCYYHEGRLGIFKLLVEGGETVKICASCHAALLEMGER